MDYTDYIVIHIAGAVYCLSEMIIFEILQNITGELVMRVIVQYEDILEDTFLYNWSEIPTSVLEIYTCVNSKSYIKDNILYGTHIGRKQDHEYVLVKFNKHPIGEYNQTSTEITSKETDITILNEIHSRMKYAKSTM